MRENPEKPLHVFEVEKDPGCTGDLAADRPELVARAKAVFAKAHTDSASYINPGEPKRQTAKPAKKQEP